MLRVKDENGNIIQGLYKDSKGTIVVEKNSEYQRYIKEKQQQETINNLSKEVSELKDMLHTVISSLKGDAK